MDRLHPRRWCWPRFSIGELMLFIAGFAVGLAYARVDGTDRWPDFLLACFLGWFVVGLMQKAWRTWVLRRRDASITVIDALWPLAVATFVVFGGTMQAAARHKWEPFLDSTGYTSWSTSDFTETAIYLAVICGYYQRRTSDASNGWRRRLALVVEIAAWLLGAYWLSVVLEEGILVVGLVHIAIRGVEAAQPTRWSGHEFYPANLHFELLRQFVLRAYWTTALLAGAVAAIVALACAWARGWPMRLLWSVVCLVCLVAVLQLERWCLRVAFPTLSPFFYSVLGTLPPANFAMALAIVAAGSAAFAGRVCAVPRPSMRPDQIGVVPPCLYERPLILCLYLLAASAKGFVSTGEAFGSLFGPVDWWKVPYLLIEATTWQPRTIIWLASLILVGQRVWHASIARQAAQPQLWSVPTAKFAVAWLLALLTGLLMIPAASWLGLALYLRWGAQ